MSSILRRRKKLALLLLFLIAVTAAFTKFWPLSVLLVLAILLLVADHIVERKANKSQLLCANRQVKTTDCLVIGDMCHSDITECNGIAFENALFITAPSRSLEASYVILAHTFTILNGATSTCIITHKKSRCKRPFTLFDTPYLHFLTIRKLGLERLAAKAHHPLLHEPTKSLRILLGCKPKGYVQTDCPDRRIVQFCQERGIKLVYLERT